MALSHENWKRGEENEKVAKMTRSIAQDMGRLFKRDAIRKIYSEKKVNGVDIGAVCTDWTYTVLTNLAYNEPLLDRLLKMIYLAYQRNKNLDEDRLWLMYMATKGLISFSDKVDGMPIIAKLSFMGQLEKPPSEEERDASDITW
jgi:hypothetical protein